VRRSRAIPIPIPVPAAVGLAVAVVAVGLVRLRRGVLRVKVVGWSMQPALGPGDEVLARRVPVESLAVGDIVVLAEPRSTSNPRPAGAGGEQPLTRAFRDHPARPGAASGQLIIKRIAGVAGEIVPVIDLEPVPDGTVALLGDNLTASVDSRHFGAVPADRILGRVVRHLSAPDAPENTR
jgi:signal peptidase I